MQNCISDAALAARPVHASRRAARWRQVTASTFCCMCVGAQWLRRISPVVDRVLSAFKKKERNEIQPWHADAVGNRLLYVWQRTVCIGHNGYKCSVDGWSQFRFILCWPEKTGMRICLRREVKEHQRCGRRRTRSRLMYARNSFLIYFVNNYFRRLNMIHLQKHLSASLIALAALLAAPMGHWLQPHQTWVRRRASRLWAERALPVRARSRRSRQPSPSAEEMWARAP